jgi:hypothetical protein
MQQALSLDAKTEFAYLFEFPEGIWIRTQVMKLYKNFVIFFPNHLLNDRLEANKNQRLTNLEFEIPTTHMSGLVSDVLIVKEIKDLTEACGSLEKKYGVDGLKWFHKYLYKAFLPLVYKFIKGVVSLYARDDQLNDIKGKVEEIYDAFNQMMAFIPKMLGSNPRTLSVADGIMKTVTKVDFLIGDPEDSDTSIETTCKSLGDDVENDLEQDEVLYRTLFELRRKGALVLAIIDELYKDTGHAGILGKYQRNAEINLKTGTDLSVLNAFMISSASFQKKYGNLMNQNQKEKSFDADLGAENSDGVYYKSYTCLIEIYKSLKMSLNENIQNNMFYRQLRESHKEETVVKYLLRSIKGMKVGLAFKNLPKGTDAKPKSDSRLYSKNYWLNPNWRYFIITLDNLITACPKIRKKIFEITVGSKKDAFEVTTKADGTEELTLTNAYNSNEYSKEIWGKLYYLFIELYYISAHKTFMDEDWGMMTSQFYLLKNLFQNLCEGNFQAFKKFFCKFIPKCSENAAFNTRGQTLVFNYYVH